MGQRETPFVPFCGGDAVELVAILLKDQLEAWSVVGNVVDATPLRGVVGVLYKGVVALVGTHDQNVACAHRLYCLLYLSVIGNIIEPLANHAALPGLAAHSIAREEPVVAAHSRHAVPKDAAVEGLIDDKIIAHKAVGALHEVRLLIGERRVVGVRAVGVALIDCPGAAFLVAKPVACLAGVKERQRDVNRGNDTCRENGQSAPAACGSLAHELAHALCQRVQAIRDERYRKNRGQRPNAVGV